VTDDEIAHRHGWETRARVDQCHYTQVVEYCHCGATRSVYEQRDFDEPLQVAFARIDCPDCRLLLRGREPDSWGVRT